MSSPELEKPWHSVKCKRPHLALCPTPGFLLSPRSGVWNSMRPLLMWHLCHLLFYFAIVALKQRLSVALCLSSWISWDFMTIINSKLNNRPQRKKIKMLPSPLATIWVGGEDRKLCPKGRQFFVSRLMLSSVTANSHTWTLISRWSMYNLNPEC